LQQANAGGNAARHQPEAVVFISTNPVRSVGDRQGGKGSKYAITWRVTTGTLEADII
jgi:hypothetical protein